MAESKQLEDVGLRIRRLEAWRVYVPFLEEWTTSPEFGPHARSADRLILRLEDTEGTVAYGEGRCGLTGDALKASLRSWLARLGSGAGPSSCWNLHPTPIYWQEPADAEGLLRPNLPDQAFRIRHPLQAAVETAWLDLIARRAGVPLCALFGGAWRERVPVDYWMGRVSPEHAQRCVRRGKALGFTGVKLKTTLEDANVERLEAIRDEVGRDWHVTVDPNERFYRLDDAFPVIREMDRVGNMRILEDPFPRFHLEEFAALRPRINARVVLHIDPPESIHAVVASRAAGGLNMDSHTIGLAGWSAMAAAAASANLPVWHGSGLDLGIATAAQLHLCAAAPNCQLPGDQSGPWLRPATLVKEAFSVRDGLVDLPLGAGHGVTFDPEAAEEYCLEHFTLEA